jgi:hypothetical protein
LNILYGKLSNDRITR